MTKDYRSFDLEVDIQKKQVACAVVELYLEGILSLINTNNKPFLLVTYNQKDFIIPGKRNWFSGNEEYSFVLTIANMSKLLSVEWGILENWLCIEFMLRYSNKIHLASLNLFLSSLIMQILICSDWSGKLLPVAQIQ